MNSSNITNVQDRIKKMAAFTETKASNLIELDTLAKTLASKTIHTQIPEIFPIDDKTIKDHTG